VARHQNSGVGARGDAGKANRESSDLEHDFIFLSALSAAAAAASEP